MLDETKLNDENKIVNGTVENIVFRNEDNGYSVIEVDNNDVLLTLVGIMPFISEGDSIKAYGEYINHSIYGRQFKVDMAEKIMPKDESSILKYLSSGVIKGIREKLAEKIIVKFGDKSLEIIQNEYEKLSDIRGISLDKAQKIHQSYIKQIEIQSVVMFLQKYDVSINNAVKIYKMFGTQSIELIKENPYLLCDNINGIGFKISDKIANKMGYDKYSPNRIEAGIEYVLMENGNYGHTYLPWEKLKNLTQNLLEIEAQEVENQYAKLKIVGNLISEIVDNTERVYLEKMYLKEKDIAIKLISMSSIKRDKSSKEIYKDIEKFEALEEIKLSANQISGTIKCIENNICIITGGPGTGKTTMMKCIIDILESLGEKVILCAPTGRAAKRISQLSNRPAKTIHRLLEAGYKDLGKAFNKNEANPIVCDTLIIDEMSMVDTILMDALLKALKVETRIIFTGDKDQLPSVGPGDILNDMIMSDKFAIVKLNEIFRQAKESQIVINAHRINNGMYPEIISSGDFFAMRGNSSDETREKILSLVSKRLPDYLNVDPLKDIQVLSPMRKGSLGVNELNILLQEHLNPKSKTKKEKNYGNIIFREGDKVMQIRNNYDIPYKDINTEEIGEGLFNGDSGIIKEVNLDEMYMTIVFDDEKEVLYEFSNLDELHLSYATTIHKSQGSEYEVVIMPLYNGPKMLFNRNLFYTAVTRAKKMVVLVGNIEMMKKMVDCTYHQERYSDLKGKIEKICNNI